MAVRYSLPMGNECKECRERNRPLSSKHQITIPIVVLSEAGHREGDVVQVRRKVQGAL